MRRLHEEGFTLLQHRRKLVPYCIGQIVDHFREDAGSWIRVLNNLLFSFGPSNDDLVLLVRPHYRLGLVVPCKYGLGYISLCFQDIG